MCLVTEKRLNLDYATMYTEFENLVIRDVCLFLSVIANLILALGCTYGPGSITSLTICLT